MAREVTFEVLNPNPCLFVGWLENEPWYTTMRLTRLEEGEEFFRWLMRLPRLEDAPCVNIRALSNL